MRFLFLCFLIIPIIEMLVLIEVGSSIGAGYTVLLVLTTAIIGVSLLKKQGLSALLRANSKMQSGQMPVAEMGEGIVLAVAGALLLTPGFITDAIGFMLLSPAIRKAIAQKWIQAMANQQQSNIQFTEFRTGTNQSPYRDVQDVMGKVDVADADIIEGEYQKMPDDKAPPEK